MTILPTLIAAASLLGAPGPTNALFAASGAANGIRPSLRFIPVGLAAYLVSIGMLTFAFGDTVTHRPVLSAALHLVAAAFLCWSAWRIGQGSAAGAEPATPARVFWTTLLNPKALIFAFGLLPFLPPLSALGLFVGTFFLSAMGWIVLGNAITERARKPIGRRQISQATIFANLLFAAVIVGAQIRAIS